jgi:hypothetical protein
MGMNIERNGRMEQNEMKWTMTVMDCDGNYVAERSTSMSCAMMVCKRKERFFFFYFVFLFIFFFFFFFQSYYKGYSLHDCKLKNTQKCIAEILTSKTMCKEIKCIWGYITSCRSCIVIKPFVCVCVCVRPPKT